MLPNVQAENGDAGAGSRQPLEGIVLVGGVRHHQLVSLQSQPGPPAAEAAGRSSIELCLELVDRPEGLVDRCLQLGTRAVVPAGCPQDLPEEAVVVVTTPVVPVPQNGCHSARIKICTHQSPLNLPPGGGGGDVVHKGEERCGPQRPRSLSIETRTSNLVAKVVKELRCLITSKKFTSMMACLTRPTGHAVAPVAAYVLPTFPQGGFAVHDG
jgi:hypothetical protein